jgi:hypothetical protein
MRARRSTLLWFAAAMVAAQLRAADLAKVEVTVDQIPASASEIVVVFDAGAAPAAGYDDVAAAAPPPVAAAVAPADPAQNPAPPQRRRRFGGNAAPALPPPTRVAFATHGATQTTLTASVPPGENYQARVIAIDGDGPFPTVLASGRVGALKLTANDSPPLQVSLRTPELKLASTTPASVAPGAAYTLAGTITDAAHALGAKNRMRVWISEGQPPTANFAGVQTSTIDVTPNGDDVNFSFELTAPKRATTLYFQFGELPPDFARADGRQAAFLVLPDLSRGAKALELTVK